MIMNISNKRIYSLFMLIIFYSLSLLSLQARVKLPSILSDNMVLQQQSEVKLWGWANENTRIKVTTSWDKKRMEQLLIIKAIGC